MPDLGMTVALTRTLLGLGNLNINDHVNYYCSSTFLGGTMQWQRQQVTSPFVDGALTTNRTQGQVQEPVTIEVLGGTDTELQTNMAALKAAMFQDNFILLVAIGAADYQYQCEAADLQNVWVGSRFMAKQGQMVFTVYRQPVALVGGV